MNGISRILAVISAVLALHVAAVWALNAGLRTRPVEVLVPVQLLARLVEQPRPVADIPVVPVVPVRAAPTPTKPISTPQKVVPRKAIGKPVVKPAPQPIPEPVPQTVAKPRSMPVPVPAAVPVPPALPPTVDTTPSPNMGTARTTRATAPTGDAVAAPSAAAAPTLALAPAPAPLAPPAPPAPPTPVTVELPSSDARYLQNPKPRYPPISARLSEQGTVQIQVLVSDKGVAKDARIQSSSGFSRLDNAALSTVLTWRFVPGKRAGVAESMWYTVPIRFGLE